MIPRNVIDNLKCSLCKNSLSIFPIHSFGSKDIVSCGRCPLKEDFLPQREHLYEELAQHIEFACRYESNGCIEKLKPDELQYHENHCPHKPCFCPILPLGECKWQGDHSELFEHYTDAHPALALKDFGVEIDIVSSYDENYVLHQANETFIVQMRCNVDEHKIYCNVLSAAIESKMKKFTYRVSFTYNKSIFSCQDREVKFSEVGEFRVTDANTTVVNIHDILLNLNNPSCIICKIDISAETVATTQTIKKVSPYIEEENEMLKALECPVCFDYMVPPIMQCNTGHSFCESHRNDFKKKCPTCDGSVGETRNYLLEQITNIIEYPCKYNKSGCSYSSNAKDIREHETNCSHGPYRCIMDTCAWQNKYSDLRAHLVEKHKENLLETSSLTYILDEMTPVEEDTYILLTNDNIFKVIFNRQNDTFLWSLQIVGDSDEYSNYMLELDFNSQTKEKIYIRKQCGPLVDDPAIKDELIVRLNMAILNNFINDDVLIYKIRVIKVM